MADTDRPDAFRIQPIGFVRSILKRREDCPHQGRGAPDAIIEIDSAFLDALEGITAGSEGDPAHLVPRGTARRSQGPPQRQSRKPAAGRFRNAFSGSSQSRRTAPGRGGRNRGERQAAGASPRSPRRHSPRGREARPARRRRYIADNTGTGRK